MEIGAGYGDIYIRGVPDAGSEGSCTTELFVGWVMLERDGGGRSSDRAANGVNWELGTGNGVTAIRLQVQVKSG